MGGTNMLRGLHPKRPRVEHNRRLNVNVVLDQSVLNEVCVLHPLGVTFRDTSHARSIGDELVFDLIGNG